MTTVPAPPGVRLRPLRLDDIGWFSEMLIDPEAVGAHNWGGVERDLDEVATKLRRRIESSEPAHPFTGQLVVELADGTPIGDVSWRPEKWGPSEKSAFPGFGIELLPKFRGHGYGTMAQRQVVDHLFDTTDCHRVQSDTAVDNPAEQRSLEKIGMRREGLIRGCEYRDGAYHDHIVYGILRNEWPMTGS